jgi:hypothetical protein
MLKHYRQNKSTTYKGQIRPIWAPSHLKKQVQIQQYISRFPPTKPKEHNQTQPVMGMVLSGPKAIFSSKNKGENAITFKGR